MKGGCQVFVFLGKIFVWVGVILFYLLRFCSVNEWDSNSFCTWGAHPSKWLGNRCTRQAQEVNGDLVRRFSKSRWIGSDPWALLVKKHGTSFDHLLGTLKIKSKNSIIGPTLHHRFFAGQFFHENHWLFEFFSKTQNQSFVSIWKKKSKRQKPWLWDLSKKKK